MQKMTPSQVQFLMFGLFPLSTTVVLLPISQCLGADDGRGCQSRRYQDGGNAHIWKHQKNVKTCSIISIMFYKFQSVQ